MTAAIRLVLVNVPAAEWSFTVSAKRQLIGRCSDAQIPLSAQHASVSRRHAEIWQEQGDTCLCDVGSRCGTRVNGVWLKRDQPAIIIPGDRLTLGAAELRIEPVPHPASTRQRSRGGTEFSPDGDDESGTFEPPLELIGRRMVERLTYCEHNILLWMGRGYTNDEELGGILHRSRNTIRTEVANVLRKLQLRSRASVLNMLQREGATIRLERARRDDCLP